MSELKEHIGRKTLIFLILNAVIGTGIFFLPALGALQAGPASLISWVIMSVVAIFMSFYFAELVSMFPKCGGTYEYTKKAFGEFTSFIFGWVSWIVADITVEMLIIGSLKYLFPDQTLAFNTIFAVLFIVVFNYVSYRGIAVSTRLLLFFGVMSAIALLALIVPGMFYVNTTNFQPFFVGDFFTVLLATFLIAETFFGWEKITYLSEEVKDARKEIPKALIISTVIISILSTALAFVSLGAVKWNIFGSQATPLSFLATVFFGSDIGRIFTIVVFIPLIGTAASWIISSPRLLYAMSRDNIMVPRFKRLHNEHRTPHYAIVFQAIITVFITLVALGDFYTILYLLMPLAIFMYSGVLLSVVKLRIKRPDIKRGFNAPFPRAGPIAIIAFSVFLLYVWLTRVSNAPLILGLGAILVVLGVPLYILIKLQTDEKFVEKFFNRISFFQDKTFKLWYTGDDVRRIVKELRLSRDSIVLDFGCGSGTTTTAIAKKVPRGHVIAVDISEKQLQRAVDNVRKEKEDNVVLIKEYDLKFDRNTFDAISAVGVLEYLDNPAAVIKKMVSFLKPGGRFAFLSFGKTMGIPAPQYLSNEREIKKLFAGLPVSVNIIRKKKKMTEYWFIHGEKTGK